MTETEARTLLAAVARRNRAMFDSEQGQAVFTLLNQVFQRPGQWALELLQNAIDARATSLRFRGGPKGGVEVCHNGVPFTPGDIQGLCGLGLSTKRIGSTIGFMGVGFKSVFQRFQAVEIRDPVWQFRLGYEIKGAERRYATCAIPRWAPGEPLEPGFTTRFRLLPPTDVAHIAWLDDLEPALAPDSFSLAWLAHLGLQRLETPEGLWQLSVEAVEDDPDAVRVTVQGARGTATWLVFLHRYTPSADAQRDWIGRRNVSVADAPQSAVLGIGCRLGESGADLPGRGHLYAGLPLDRTWPVRLHLQAPWDVELARRDVAPLSAPWHRDLLGQLPVLLARWSKWVAAQARQHPSWTPALLIWPNQLDEDSEWGTWWGAPATQSALHDAHAAVACVPVRGAPEQLAWVQPGAARIPPRQGVASGPGQRTVGLPELPLHRLWEAIDHDNYAPWRLWPMPLASGEPLGGSPEEREAWAHAVGVPELSLEDLARAWTPAAWGSWASQWSGSEQWDRLLTVAAAVGLTWRAGAADLPLLPMEDGKGWRSPTEARRLPNEWQLLAASDWAVSVRDEVGQPDRLLLWDFIQYARQQTVGEAPWLGWRWIDEQTTKFGRRVPTLDEVLDAWWRRLEAGDASCHADTARRFTAWICGQRGLRALRGVKRLLAWQDGTLRWANPEDTYLGPPYTGSAVRTALGDTVAWVDRGYLAVGGTVEEWAAFFAALGVRTRFQWEQDVSDHWLQEEDRARFPRPIRWAYAEPATWGSSLYGGEVTVEYRRCYLVGWDVPPGWREAVEEGDTVRARAWIEWAAEDAAHLLTLLTHARYRPMLIYMDTHRQVVEIPSGNDPAWLTLLKTAAWVPTAEGLKAPAAVLLEPDPERPEALDADLPAIWREALAHVELPFGREVAQADAVERLRRATQHPAPTDALMAALEAAAEDDGVRERLRALLAERALIPLPRDASQGARLTRLVRSLARWPALATAGLVAIQDAESTPRAALYRALAERFAIPDEPTVDQAWEVLETAWRRDPVQAAVEALAAAWERVAVDGLPAPGTERADAVRVLCRNSRGQPVWVGPPWAGALLHDAAVPREIEFRAAPEALWIEEAQWGRVGDAIVFALGLTRFGARYAIRVAWDPPAVAEPRYGRGLAAVLRLLRAARREAAALAHPAPAVDRVQRLRVLVSGEAGNLAAEVSLGVYWSREDAVLRVVGNPRDFASGVAPALAADHPVLADDIRLTAEITSLVSQWDDPDWVDARTQQLMDRWGETEFDPGFPLEGESGPNGRHESASGVAGADRGSDGRAAVSGPDGSSPSDGRGPGWSGGESEALPVPDEDEAEGSGRDAESGEVRRARRPVTVLSRGQAPHGPGIDTQAVGDAGVDAACRYERSQGRLPDVLPPNHPGWDITSRDPEGAVRYIEVKATRGSWPADGVGLTPTQLEAAQARGGDYWLYVVEYVGSPDEQLYPIQDPAGQATEYRFGPGWHVDAAGPAERPRV